MISGFNLRNNCNKILRELYKLSDSSGSGGGGRTGYLTVNSASYVDTYLDKVYDYLKETDKLKQISEEKIKDFVDEFQSSSIYFLDNNIQENTRTKAKGIMTRYLDSIAIEYKEESVLERIKEAKEAITHFQYKPLSMSLKEPRKSQPIIKDTYYSELDDKEINFDKSIS